MHNLFKLNRQIIHSVVERNVYASQMARRLHVEGNRPTSKLPVEKLEVGGTFIAFRRFIPSTAAKDVGVVFCQGLMSNMDGTKAQFLEKYCREKCLRYICFDYIGHGYSSGKFEEFKIGLWKRNALDVLNKLSTGPQIIVGSSIGSWIMLLAALEIPENIHGLIGIASAPDLLYQRYVGLSDVEKHEIQRNGYYSLPSDYSNQPYRIPLETIQESANHLLLDKSMIPIDCAVRLIHGMNDNTVPYTLSLQLAKKLRTNDLTVHLIKNGDHRLSKPENLDFLAKTLDDMIFKTTACFSKF